MPTSGDQVGSSLLPPLKEAVAIACRAGGEVGLAFSGGLDSTVIARLASPLAALTGYTVGYPDSVDLQNAQEAASLLGLPWTPLILDDSAVLEGARTLLQLFPRLDPVRLSFELPLWILLPRAHPPHILAGQGADELFGGYHRYESLPEEARESSLQRDLGTLLQETMPREQRMARHQGKTLHLPYCDPAFLGAVTGIPAEIRAAPPRKTLLRDLATDLDLPSVLVQRPKKAAQYGSGVQKGLRTLAKREGKSLTTFLEGLRPSA